jgi:hypothetical protein
METTMKPEWNENTYEQQFESSLRRGPKSRPVPVVTNLRTIDPATARELRIYANEAAGPPCYELEARESLPLHPSLRATGRHYFTW